MTRLPWVTLAFVGAAAAAAVLAPDGGGLEYDRAAVTAGAWWRPLTAQLVHWGGRMAATDLGAVLLLGVVLEGRSRRAACLAIACGALAAGAGLHWLPPPVERYRGSSTVASALYLALALDLGWRARSRATRAVAAVAVAAFLGKAGLEAATGRALFAGSMPPGVEVLPGAHLLGGLGGAIGWGLALVAGRRPGPPSSQPRGSTGCASDPV